jgi:protocatechuate 3,4-dioxygenase beta subunit
MEKVTRRHALGIAGSAGAALLAARIGVPVDLGPGTALAAGTATVTPEMTEGPYWIDELLRRSDVRANTAAAAKSPGAVQTGVPLALTIRVLDAANGRAINDAHVDIWHANAGGLYSGEAMQATGGGTSVTDTSGENYLRGYQITGRDAGLAAAAVDGQVGFSTIWPGWYSGRAIHIHVRVRTYDATGTVATDYTAQIFFTDQANDKVLTGAAPYRSRSPQSDPTSDETDGVLTSPAFATNVVPVSGDLASGYAALFTIYLSGPGAGTEVAAGASGRAVSASLRSAKVTRAANGARTAVLTVRAGETVTATATLARGTAVVGRATGRLTAGTHVVKVGLGTQVAAGAVTLELTLADRAGNRTAVKRTLVVPA